jgi:hypothetical protein
MGRLYFYIVKTLLPELRSVTADRLRQPGVLRTELRFLL